MKKSVWSGGVTVAVVAGFLGLAPAATSETLTDALIWAYQSSPALETNRAALRAVDEGVVQAYAGKRPQVTVSGSATASHNSSNTARDITDTYSAALNASLVLYDGGATEAAVASARANVAAARANLEAVEQSVLLQAIAAYVDVRRDARFLALAENNVRVITQQVEAAEDRFEVGEVTRTDVSQATARLASARSNLAANRGGLERSNQAYLVAVGRSPGALAPPPALPKLPATLDRAQAISMREHPSVVAAQAAVKAAEHDVERAKAALAPTVSLSGSLSHNINTQIYGEGSTSASITLRGEKSLFDGGRNDSLVRQAFAVLDRRKAELMDAARGVKQETALAWSNLEVARASIRAARQQIRAAKIAFDGVTEEAKLGARTTLDVLDAEQEVLNAQSDLAASERDEYVAAYNLVSAMGLLSVDYLGLGVARYDPNVYYQSVAGQVPQASRQGTALDRISDRWNN